MPRGRESTRGGRVLVEPRWGLGDAIAAVVVAYSSAILLSSLVSDPNHLTLVEQSLLTLPLWICAIGVPVWATTTKGNGPRIDLGLELRPFDVPVGLLIGGIAQIVIPWTYRLLLSEPTWRELDAPARELGRHANSVGGKVLLVLTIVVVAPFAEELLYRGLVLAGLERRLPSFAALVVCSVVFAAMHFQLLQFAGLAVFGMVLGALVQRTGRLGPAIFAHVGFNAVAVAQLNIW